MIRHSCPSTLRVSMCCLCVLLASSACAPGGPSRFALTSDDGGDYLDPELRAAVEQLQSDVGASPTDETTIAVRARVLADWADAYALAGGEVGLEGPRVRLRATVPPSGPAARRASADLDRLVREFTLRDEPGDYRQSDPLLEPLVEMMSMHGSFEWFMRAYLSRGHQVGLIAASDDHLSHPGYSAPNRSSLAQRGGLAAVLAPERSRDAIFDAMKTRRTYATTGDRIILDMRVNGTTMGQRAPFAERREVTGRVIGTAPIESIVLYKNDEVLWQRDYLVDVGAGSTQELLLSFHSDATPYHVGDAPRGWRHWRGTLTVEGARLDAVAGTDFVNPTTQLLSHDGNTARFATNTRGDTSSLRLTLSSVQPGAVITLDFEEAMETGSGPPSDRVHQLISAGQARLLLRDLRDGRLEQPMPIEGYADGVVLRRIVTDGP
ncbi:MAG: DUF3604 domain-containing protein, partial [Acidobacteria bacterium]|nr:DUF3604 domain-containing protein [Acidobacteriota bacterium]